MLEFLTNYWMILLIAFILILLVILGYLVDREKKDNGDIPNLKSVDDEVDLKINNIEQNPENFIDKKNDDLESPTNEVIEIDEEISKIDKKFESVVSKRKLIDDDLKKEIDDLQIKPIEIAKKDEKQPEIELPDIKINKN